MDPGFACKRAPNDKCMATYQSRISGPLLDRIDLAIDVPAVTPADLVLPAPQEGSADVAGRVAAARRIQSQRYEAAGLDPAVTNASCPANLLDQVAALDSAGVALVRAAADTMKLTARGYHRVLRVARTLADLEAAEKVTRAHLAEALAYRSQALA